MQTEYCAGALVYLIHRKELQFLLLLDAQGSWLFPKGHIEQGEDEISAAKREVLEEAGIVIESFEPKFRVGNEYHYVWEGKKGHKIVVFYLGNAGKQKIRVNEEHVDGKWFAAHDAITVVAFNENKAFLQQAMRHLGFQ